MLVPHWQTGKHFHMDNKLYDNLLRIREIVMKKDFDWVTLIVGLERSGKSTIASQLAYVCADGEFEQEDICLTFAEFQNRVRYHIDKNNKGRSVIFDETMGVADTRSFNNIYSKQLRRLLAECGQANLFLFILLPSFFDLDRPIALHRANTLVRVEVNPQNWDRGRWYLYNRKKKNKMYLENKKTYQYRGKPNMHGKYPNFYCMEEIAYRKRKADVLRNFEQTDDSTLSVRYRPCAQAFFYLTKHLVEEKGYTKEKIAKITRLAHQTISSVHHGKGMYGEFLKKNEPPSPLQSLY